MKELRLLSRRVIIDGQDRGLCIVTISQDGKVSAVPFRTETHSTVYIPHPIILTTEKFSKNRVTVHQDTQAP